MRALSLRGGISLLMIFLGACTPEPPGWTSTWVAYLNYDEARSVPRGSRSQGVFLKSMATQHPHIQLRIVDTSGLGDTERRARHEGWGLGAYDLHALDDKRGHWFRGESPTVVLLGPMGSLEGRWEGFVGPSVLDEAARAVSHQSHLSPKASPTPKAFLPGGPALPSGQ